MVLDEPVGVTPTTVNAAFVGGLIGLIAATTWKQQKVRCGACETVYVRG